MSMQYSWKAILPKMETPNETIAVSKGYPEQVHRLMSCMC